MTTNDERGGDSPASATSAAGLTTLVDVLAQLHEAGWTADLRTEPDGMVRCPSCEGSIPASELEVVAHRRLEGASDPADMQLVVAARCRGCGSAGVLTLGFGPNADERDADVLAELTLPDQSMWPPPPPGS